MTSMEIVCLREIRYAMTTWLARNAVDPPSNREWIEVCNSRLYLLMIDDMAMGRSPYVKAR
jgi:hypothetical protein